MTRFVLYGSLGVGSCSMVAQDFRRAVRMWRLLQSRRNPDIRELAFGIASAFSWLVACCLVGITRRLMGISNDLLRSSK